MALTYIRRAAVALSLLAAASCTVKSNEAPVVSGPSGLSLTLTVNAIPDSISQDGGSQSSVKVTAIGPDGKGLAGVPLRIDMAVNGTIQDFGALSARSVVTNGDGVATTVYTAPPSTNFATCGGLPGNCVQIIATATSTNFTTSNPEFVVIRLVPTGVILPAAGAPTAAFDVTPQPVQMNVAATFDASRSQPGTGATAISSYSWNFGDGTSATGKSVNHTFTSQSNYNVTLTVTNDRGLSSSVTNVVQVGSVTAPSPSFVFSPAAPQIGQSIVFNADGSTAAPGHSLTAFSWNFGDGASATGSIATHAYSQAGTYNVVLTVTDDTGQRVTKSNTVAVSASGGGGGGAATVAQFLASPSSPVVGQVVFFNASASSASTGHTITRYAWDFGDGTVFSSTSATTSHTFQTSGAFTVSLTVTDDGGTTAKTTNTVTVAAAGAASPTAAFTSSPNSPAVNQSVFFNASTSTAGSGHTLSSYAWDFGDGATGTGVTTSHAYGRTGTFTVNLTVTDEAGQAKSTSATVQVTGSNSSSIVAEFGFSPSNPDISDGTNVNVHFDATPSTGSGTLTYDWLWGDGASTPNGGKLPSHTFAVAGTYTVRLTVTDSTGATATITHTVPVQP